MRGCGQQAGCSLALVCVFAPLADLLCSVFQVFSIGNALLASSSTSVSLGCLTQQMHALLGNSFIAAVMNDHDLGSQHCLGSMCGKGQHD